MKPMIEDKYFTVKQVAEYLCCSRTTAYKLFRRRNFPSVLVGATGRSRRVKRSELDKYLAAQTNQ